MEIGSIYLERSRKRWRAKVRVVDDDGTATVLTHTTAVPVGARGTGKRDAMREAEEWLDNYIKSIGTPRDAPPPRVTVAELVSRRIARLQQTQAVEPSTVRAYHVQESLISRAPFASLAADDLDGDAINAWIANLLGDGLSASSVKKAYNALRTAYADAVDAGLVQSTPFTRAVRPPRVTARRPNALPDDERARLEALLGGSTSAVAIGARLALYAGLRRGECCGLRWCDVTSDSLTITQSIGLGRGGDSVAYIKSVKTKSGARTIPLPQSLGMFLDGLRRTARNAYVIPGARNVFLSPAVLGRDWAAFARTHELRGTEGRIVTFHDLRHTFATLAVRNTDPVTAARLLGHASPALTLEVYATTDSAAMRNAIINMDDALSVPRGGILEWA